MGTDAPRIVPDVVSGEPRVLATARRARPHRPAAGGCPFCPGNEEATPPEVSRVARSADGRWTARCIPNLYPLLPTHELVVMTPRHVESARDLSDDEWLATAQLLVERYREHEDHPDHVVSAFINDGERAGASIPHAHLQLVAGPVTELASRWMLHAVDPGSCGVCHSLAANDLRIAERSGAVLCAHPTPIGNGGLLAGPAAHDSSLTRADPEVLAAALGMACRAAPTDVDFNVLLRSRPDLGHWHLEVVPRRGYQAGAELSLGIGVTLTDPAEVAAGARERLAHA